MQLGDSFLGGGEVQGENHLWFVINDPPSRNGVALIVNISELRPGAEQTCILQKGEHKFIHKPSYVRFMSARRAKASDLDKLIKADKLKPHQTASEPLIKKIRAAAAASPLLSSELKTLL